MHSDGWAQATAVRIWLGQGRGEDLREKQQRVGLPHLAGATKDALYRLDHVGVGVSRREGGELRPLDLVRGRLGVIAG